MPCPASYADGRVLELAYNGVALSGLDLAVIERNVLRGWITPGHRLTGKGREELLRRMPIYGKIPPFHGTGGL